MTQGVGTPMYMSLEMLRREAYDASTDLWSFGVLLWEIAAQAAPDLLQQEGHTPGRGPMYGTLLRCLEDGRRLAIDAAWPQVWQALMGQCWQREPDSRPKEFAAITRALVPEEAGSGSG